MNVLASGAYGHGNFADDCYVDVLRSRMAGTNMDFLSQVDKTQLRLFSYDATMLAGGGLQYDQVAECGTRSLKHYLRYPAIAQWPGKKNDHVIVCHEGAAGKTIDLLGIAVETGKRIWEFDIWRHSIHSISESDVASHRGRLTQTQGVTA